MRRREFLGGASLIVANGLAQLAIGDAPAAQATATQATAAQATAAHATAALTLPKVPARQISMLPTVPAGGHQRLALTLDDGTSPAMLSRYMAWAEQNGHGITLFVYGAMSSWLTLRPQILRLIKKGTVQLANHTMHHLPLTKISDQAVHDEIMGCHYFLLNHFGVDSRPYFRPPYGYIDQRVTNIAAKLGYTTPVMWSGSIGDYSSVSAAQIEALAQTWFTKNRIVIGHANSTNGVVALPVLEQILARRGLKSVTLDQVFSR